MTTNPPIRTTEQISRQRRQMVVAVVAMLMASAACVAIAPMLMPDSYSVVEHSISESAAQGVQDAWLARLGFLLLGFAVLTSASIAGERWGVWGRLVHRAYGVSMFGVAAFAHMPWEDVPYDAFEDFLHSVAAYGIGFFFTAGVLIVTFRREPGMRSARLFDWITIVAALVIPMMMFNITGIAGLVQRVLFGIGYLWYGMEAVRSGRTDDPVDQPVSYDTPASLAGAVRTSKQEAAQ
ncbi:MAG: DUF998 domain-containing protein [Gemmatimonadota bacterium]|nr:DUF998 domain-containing protein [Acidimicrobiia bacterium]MDH3367884.1 DUF998 domain-containing protein [Gemmatimonadota bacterium]MDH5616083.1 DUF998 domain-containing protein [Acidimicrobiia bacterium]